MGSRLSRPTSPPRSTMRARLSPAPSRGPVVFWSRAAARPQTASITSGGGGEGQRKKACSSAGIRSQASQTFHALGIPHGTVQAGRMSDPLGPRPDFSIQTIAAAWINCPRPHSSSRRSASPGAASWEAGIRCPAARVLSDRNALAADGPGWFNHGSWFKVHRSADLIGNGSSALSPFAPATPGPVRRWHARRDFKHRRSPRRWTSRRSSVTRSTLFPPSSRQARRGVRGGRDNNSRQIAAQFMAAGIPAEHVDGSMATEARDAAVERFRRGETLILSNDSPFWRRLRPAHIEGGPSCCVLPSPFPFTCNRQGARCVLARARSKRSS